MTSFACAISRRIARCHQKARSPKAKPSCDNHLPFGRLFDEIESQMTSSNFSRGSKVRTPKPRMSPSALAEQFLQLKRLRKKVYELEKRLAGEIQQGASDDETDPTGNRK